MSSLGLTLPGQGQAGWWQQWGPSFSHQWRGVLALRPGHQKETGGLSISKPQFSDGKTEAQKKCDPPSDTWPFCHDAQASPQPPLVWQTPSFRCLMGSPCPPHMDCILSGDAAGEPPVPTAVSGPLSREASPAA